MCKMTENMQADVALSRKAVFVRCCLRKGVRGITLFPPEKGFPRVTAPTKLISVERRQGNRMKKKKKYVIIDQKELVNNDKIL